MSTFTTSAPEETLRLGEAVARELVAGDVVALYGELGSGKTVFTKGLAAGLGAAEPREVTSPTYVIMVEYGRGGEVALRHFDAYRLRSAEEFLALDGGELLGPDSGAVSVVEWADRVADALPRRRVEFTFEVTGPGSRRITARSLGGREEIVVRERGIAG